MQQQQAMTGKSKEAVAKEKEKELREKAKHEEEKRRKEEAALFKPVQTQKIPFGVDPKTVLCAFYKAGNCEKGNKCKFSHDLNVGRKVEKKNLYADSREDKMKGTVFMSELAKSLIVFFIRYYGELGRREATECSPIEARQSQNNNRRGSGCITARTSTQRTYRSCASFLLRLSKLKSADILTLQFDRLDHFLF